MTRKTSIYDPVAPWELWTRVPIAVAILAGACLFFWLGFPGTETFIPIESSAWRDLALIFATYAVVAVRREDNGWVLAFNTVIVLGSFVFWYVGAITENEIFSAGIVLLTIVATLVSPTLPGLRVWVWQSAQKPPATSGPANPTNVQVSTANSDGSEPSLENAPAS